MSRHLDIGTVRDMICGNGWEMKPRHLYPWQYFFEVANAECLRLEKLLAERAKGGEQ